MALAVSPKLLWQHAQTTTCFHTFIYTQTPTPHPLQLELSDGLTHPESIRLSIKGNIVFMKCQNDEQACAVRPASQ